MKSNKIKSLETKAKTTPKFTHFENVAKFASNFKWLRKNEVHVDLELDTFRHNIQKNKEHRKSSIIVLNNPATISRIEQQMTSSSSSSHNVTVKRSICQCFRTCSLDYLKTYVIDPSQKFYYYWLFIFFTCYIYNIIFLIARTAFWELQNIEQFYVWYIIDYGVSDFVYVLDILIKFRSGFMVNGELCRDLVKIKALYLKSFKFKIDLLSLVPTDAFYFLLPIAQKHFLPALRLNRLVRLYRCREFLEESETQTSYPNVFRMSSLIINILLLMHWNACIYFLISYFIGFGSDEWVYPALTDPNQLTNYTTTQLNNMLLTHLLSTQYIYCFWWSTQTLTTIAEVPFPRVYYEQLYMSMLLIVGIIILATIIGSTSNMFANANNQRDQFQGKCDHIKRFLKQHKIDRYFGRRIQTYLDYLWSQPNLDQQDNILESLPSKLSVEIAMNIHMDTLKRVHIFQDCEPGLLRDLVAKLKLKLFSPGDYVCRKGDIGREMYFIKTGKLEVVSVDGKQIFAVLNAGAAFGEISILDIPGNKNGNKRTANIRSVGFSDLFELTKDDLWSALSEYPLAKQALLEKGKALLQKDNIYDEELAEKIERKHKSAPIQVDSLNTSVDRLSTKLDTIYELYINFLIEIKQKLTYLEKLSN